MGMPTRHGQNWGRQGPTPVGSGLTPRQVLRQQGGGAPVQGPGSECQTVRVPTPVPVQTQQIVTARILNTFFQTLPSKTLQFFVESGEVRTTASNLVANNRISVIDVQVPEKTVWVITGTQFFGVAPSSLLEGPIVYVSAEQMMGMIRFELKLADHEPMQTHGTYIDPLDAASTGSSGNSGLPYSDAPHVAGFALYATGGQSVRVTAQIDSPPRFWLTALAARLTGFTLPELTFDRVMTMTSNGVF